MKIKNTPWVYVALIIFALSTYLILSRNYVDICTTNYNTALLKLSLGDINGIAFYDSGNELTDPYTKAPVVILDYRILKSIISDMAYDILKEYRNTGYFDYGGFIKYTGIKIYPLTFRTISEDFSIMPAFRLEELILDNKNCYKNITAGISINKLSCDNSYTILLNKKIKPYK